MQAVDISWPLAMALDVFITQDLTIYVMPARVGAGKAKLH